MIQLSIVWWAGKSQRFLGVPGRKPVVLHEEPVRTRTGSAGNVSVKTQQLYLTLASSSVP